MSDPGQNQGTPAQAQTKPGLTQADLQHHEQELGMLGHVFGSREHAPIYIAGLAIIIAFVLLALVLFFGPDSTEFPKYEAVTLFGTIITGALGFLFGRSGN